MWVPGETTVLRDAKGFVLTGRDLLANAACARIRKERREPMPLETSVPGVFAASDVRAGAMNRVASAVSEGSTVVPFAHEYLALTCIGSHCSSYPPHVTSSAGPCSR